MKMRRAAHVDDKSIRWIGGDDRRVTLECPQRETIGFRDVIASIEALEHHLNMALTKARQGSAAGPSPKPGRTRPA